MNSLRSVFFAMLLAGFLIAPITGCKKEDPTYSRVYIKSFTIPQIPFAKPGGGSWEDLPLIEGGPDVYWLLTDSNDSVYYGSRDLRFDNVTQSHLPLVRVLQSPHYVNPLNASWFIKIYDYDLIGGDDLMATIGPIDFSKYSKDAPGTISISGDSAVVRMDVDWRE